MRRRNARPKKGGRTRPFDVIKLIVGAASSEEDLSAVFHQTHLLSNLDGEGCGVILSKFVLRADSSKSFIATLSIRVHDDVRNHVFMPDDDPRRVDVMFDETKRTFSGLIMAPAPYHLLCGLVSATLLRMESSGKHLNGKEQRLVVSLYTKPPENGSTLPALPCRRPAPDVDSLFLTFSRPLYWFWGFMSEFPELAQRGRFITRPGDKRVFIRESLRLISANAYIRKRLAASLEYHGDWHHYALGEGEVGAWLRWEARALRRAEEIGEGEGRAAFERSAAAHYMANRLCDMSIQYVHFPIAMPTGQDTEAGHALATAFMMRSDYYNRGGIHPEFVLDCAPAEGDVDEDTGSATAASLSAAAGGAAAAESRDMQQLVGSLASRRASCAVCGVSSADLQCCSKCRRVSYCGRKHQRMHWKSGHKQECVTTAKEITPEEETTRLERLQQRLDSI